MELLCIQATAINFSIHCYVHKRNINYRNINNILEKLDLGFIVMLEFKLTDW